MHSILLVDDDEKLGDLMTEYLSRHGFSVSVRHTPSAGLAALSQKTYAAVIFDVMLPEMSGLELCKLARQRYPRLPILMLTARGDLADKVAGLEIGADDYLAKPFEPRELSARLSALLRRVDRMPENDLSFQGLRINLALRRVWLTDLDDAKNNEEEVILTAAEFRILAELTRCAPAVVDRDTLIENIRGFERDVFDRSVDIAVSRLRNKLKDAAGSPKFIQTMRGAGYAFIAPPK